MHPVSVHGQIVGGANGEAAFTRVEIDSRGIRSGDIFWALRGEHHDGHSFLVEARRRDAGLAVVRRDRLSQAQEAWKIGSGHGPVPPLIVVEDTLTALADFARWYRSQQEGLVVGVTGSFGKTTTREMIHAVVSAAHSGVRSLKNFNNHIGLPLSLLDLDQSHEFAVLEMGASAVGEIAMLAEIARPEVGVITGIGLAHVDGFGSTEKIVLGKGELLEALPATGFAILPGDDPVTRGMADRSSCPVLFVGDARPSRQSTADVRGRSHRIRSPRHRPTLLASRTDCAGDCSRDRSVANANRRRVRQLSSGTGTLPSTSDRLVDGDRRHVQRQSRLDARRL